MYKLVCKKANGALIDIGTLCTSRNFRDIYNELMRQIRPENFFSHSNEAYYTMHPECFKEDYINCYFEIYDNKTLCYTVRYIYSNVNLINYVKIRRVYKPYKGLKNYLLIQL